MEKIGRNDPCPCGSGKKYKKCHLAADESAPRPALEVAAGLHALDHELSDNLAAFARQRYADATWKDNAIAAFEAEDEADEELLLPWLVFHAETPSGTSLADEFMQERGETIPSWRLFDWLEAQGLAWLSAWEILDAKPGEALALRDLLTGEERTVMERTGSRTLRRGQVVLGRVATAEGVSVLAGMHGFAADPREGAEFAREVKRRLGAAPRAGAKGRAKRTKARPAAAAGLAPVDLRSEAATLVLVRRWRRIFEDRRNAPLPEVRNTAGDALLLTNDHFAFEESARAEIARRLGALPGAEADRDGASGVPDRFVFSEEKTIVATARFEDRRLVLSTNSTARADRWRALVERACGELVRFLARDTSDPIAVAMQNRASGRPLPPREPPPADAIAAVREFKIRHYRAWLDEKIPALRGKTPREAARAKSGAARDEVALLVKEIELGESRLPEAERADLSFLRKELGLAGVNPVPATR